MKLEFSYEPKEFTKAMRKLLVLVILSKKKTTKFTHLLSRQWCCRIVYIPQSTIQQNNEQEPKI